MGQATIGRQTGTGRYTQPMTESTRLKELKALMAICFTILDDLDIREIANLTALSLPTIYKFRKGIVTLDVRFRTIQAIGIAAGLQVIMTGYTISVRLRKG